MQNAYAIRNIAMNWIPLRGECRAEGDKKAIKEGTGHWHGNCYGIRKHIVFSAKRTLLKDTKGGCHF